MRKGNLATTRALNVGVDFKALIYSPSVWSTFKVFLGLSPGRNFYIPRNDNIQLLRDTALHFNLYLFFNTPRTLEHELPEILSPLGYIRSIHYTNDLELRGLTKEWKIDRFLASSDYQANVIGNNARFFDSARKYEKELFQ